MARQKHKWTPEEEAALHSGVVKHGPGKWKHILSDPELSSSLIDRSNVDLKDKWRNYTRFSRTPNLERVAINSSPEPVSVQPLSAVPHSDSGGTSEPFPSSVDRLIAPDYEALIFEALSSVNDPNGADSKEIINLIEQRYDHELPLNFRRSVTSKLRRLVLKGVLEKVDNRYKLKGAASSGLRDGKVVLAP